MIGITKLLMGKATVSEAIRLESGPRDMPRGMLQFSEKKGPVIVWNITKACNLKCMHCYQNSDSRQPTNELSTDEAKQFIDDVSSLQIPVLLFSGGEPLLRKDIFLLADYARKKGLYCALSTNGTLVDRNKAEEIKRAGFVYAGISLDGLEETHDHFRGEKGSWEMAWEGIANLKTAGLKTGVRFTATKRNIKDLPAVIDMCASNGVERFCMYHLVYSGRASILIKEDLDDEQHRNLIKMLIEKSIEYQDKIEILTVDNPSDGIYLLDYVKKNIPDRYEDVHELLRRAGGCSAGEKIACVGPEGSVYPCQFWKHESLDNIRERRFSEIWSKNKALIEIRVKDTKLRGRCGACAWKSLCHGCRLRAMVKNRSIWEEDPSCYVQHIMEGHK